MNGKHSYDRIAELLQDTFNEYSLLREQIVSTVTDNGSNFIKAFKEFGYDIQDHNMTDDMDLVILTMKVLFLSIFITIIIIIIVVFIFFRRGRNFTFSSYCSG